MDRSLLLPLLLLFTKQNDNNNHNPIMNIQIKHVNNINTIDTVI